MNQDHASLHAALAEAVGDDPALIAELRAAFLESASVHARRLREASGDAEWRIAAWKLQGLAASFGAVALMEVAESAAKCRSAAMLVRIERAIEGFGG